MFNWGQSLYYALRAAIYGAIFGFIVVIVIKITGGAPRTLEGIVAFFWLFGIVRLGWDVFAKKYPDA
jgi:hypothetical protein